MTIFVQRLILVLAAAAIATPALSETVRHPTNSSPPAGDRGHARPLSAEELSASAGGRPSEASSRDPSEQLAAARKAINQLLGTIPAAARKAG